MGKKDLCLAIMTLHIMALDMIALDLDALSSAQSLPLKAFRL